MRIVFESGWCELEACRDKYLFKARSELALIPNLMHMLARMKIERNSGEGATAKGEEAHGYGGFEREKSLSKFRLGPLN